MPCPARPRPCSRETPRRAKTSRVLPSHVPDSLIPVTESPARPGPAWPRPVQQRRALTSLALPRPAEPLIPPVMARTTTKQGKNSTFFLFYNEKSTMKKKILSFFLFNGAENQKGRRRSCYSVAVSCGVTWSRNICTKRLLVSMRRLLLQ